MKTWVMSAKKINSVTLSFRNMLWMALLLYEKIYLMLKEVHTGLEPYVGDFM